jgi:hypothetical protein
MPGVANALCRAACRKYYRVSDADGHMTDDVI